MDFKMKEEEPEESSVPLKVRMMSCFLSTSDGGLIREM